MPQKKTVAAGLKPVGMSTFSPGSIFQIRYGHPIFKGC